MKSKRPVKQSRPVGEDWRKKAIRDIEDISRGIDDIVNEKFILELMVSELCNRLRDISEINGRKYSDVQIMGLCDYEEARRWAMDMANRYMLERSGLV